MIGYAAGRNPTPDPFPTLRRWNDTISLNYALQFPLILGLGLFAGLSGLAGTGYLLSRSPSRRGAVGAVVALAVTAWVPAILLLPLDRPWERAAASCPSNSRRACFWQAWLSARPGSWT